MLFRDAIARNDDGDIRQRHRRPRRIPRQVARHNHHSTADLSHPGAPLFDVTGIREVRPRVLDVTRAQAAAGRQRPSFGTGRVDDVLVADSERETASLTGWLSRHFERARSHTTEPVEHSERYLRVVPTRLIVSTRPTNTAEAFQYASHGAATWAQQSWARAVVRTGTADQQGCPNALYRLFSRTFCSI